MQDATTLSHAIHRLVALKREADVLAAGPNPVLLDRQVEPSPDGPVDSWDFARRVLPFLTITSTTTRSGQVPLDRLLGESWRWRPDDVDPPKRTGLASYLLDPARALPGDRDHARVMSWPALGLHIAHEGKNRVAFLQSMGAEAMPAEVSEEHYPAPESLARYSMPDDPTGPIWVVCQDRLAQPLPLYRIARPILDAYGVAPLTKWPGHLPSPRLVRAAYREACEDRQHIEGLPGAPITIDLLGVTPPVMPSAAPLHQSALELLGSDLRRGALAAAVAVLGVAATGWRMVSNAPNDTIGMLLVGAAAGGLLALTLPLFRSSKDAHPAMD